MQQFSHPGRSLVEISPSVSADTLLADLVPPPEFSTARFSTYVQDRNFPSQEAAVLACREFLGIRRKLFGKKESSPGIYLDGGFGVGKTHLLASIWHEHKGKKLFGAFLDMTAITGYLGFAEMAKMPTQPPALPRKAQQGARLIYRQTAVEQLLLLG